MKTTLTITLILISIITFGQQKWPSAVNGVITLQSGVIYEPKNFNNESNLLIKGNGAIVSGFKDYDGKMPIIAERDVITRNGKLLSWSQGEGAEWYVYRDGEARWYIFKEKYNEQTGNGIRVNDPNTVTDSTYAYTPILIFNRNLHVTDPNGIQYSSIGNGIEINNSNVIIENLTICGVNRRGIHGKESNITLRNVEVWGTGWDGVGMEGGMIEMFNCNIHDVLGNGVFLGEAHNSKCYNSNFERIGMQPGKGEYNGKTNYVPACAWRNQGSNNIIFENNYIEYTQYHGIANWYCYGHKVHNNIVKYTLQLLDDGGGVYSWARSSAGQYCYDWEITNNKIYYSWGSLSLLSGAYSDLLDGNGIYIDDGNRNGLIKGNEVYGATVGLFIHNSDLINVDSNYFYDVTNGARYRNNHSSHDIKGCTFTNNYIDSKGYNIYAWSQSQDNQIALNNVWNNNVYKTDVFQVNDSWTNREYSLNEWQTIFKQDLNSVIGEKQYDTIVPEPEPTPNICDSVFVTIYDTVKIDTVINIDSIYTICDTFKIFIPIKDTVFNTDTIIIHDSLCDCIDEVDIIKNRCSVYFDGLLYTKVAHQSLEEKLITFRLQNPGVIITWECKGRIE